MFLVHIIAIGKQRDKGLLMLQEEYLKRLGPFIKVELQEFPETPFSSTNDRAKIIDDEAKKIVKHIKKDGLLFVMHEAGTQFTSVKFSNFLEKHTQKGERITFVIGGPLGLAQSILDIADVQISLSPMTFTHQMARVILLEQLYRAATISSGKKYHY